MCIEQRLVHMGHYAQSFNSKELAGKSYTKYHCNDEVFVEVQKSKVNLFKQFSSNHATVTTPKL